MTEEGTVYTKNHTERIGVDFSLELKEIEDRREESGLDKKRRSTRELTNLIIKHVHWPVIKEEMIELNIGGEDG